MSETNPLNRLPFVDPLVRPHPNAAAVSTGYCLPTTGYCSFMVYDAGGKLSAEYSQFAAPTTVNVDFITPNYQGSTSVVTDNAGAVKARHDYLPFGEEIGDGVGSRTTAKKFSQTDSIRQKYAGMETDDATGLNHTLWRKDDNWSGRWTSPDPYGGSMSTANPQSFNRYTYCNNDPVNHVDPLGLALADIGIYQTNDPEEAETMQKHFDGEFQSAANDSAQRRHEATSTNPFLAFQRMVRDQASQTGGTTQQPLSGILPGFFAAMKSESDRLTSPHFAV